MAAATCAAYVENRLLPSGIAIARPRCAKLRTRLDTVNMHRPHGIPPEVPIRQMRRERGGRCGVRMLDVSRRLVTPSLRSDVQAFMVMDVVAAAARLEAAGRRIIHMEIGQPAAAAPACAIAAAQATLATGRIGYTPALGNASLRRRIARHYAERHGAEIDS